MKNQTNINFFGIGAQKAGTSWLFHNLKQIPQFDLLPIKELHYFDRSPSYQSPNFLSEASVLKRFKNKKYRKLVFKILLDKASSFQLRTTLFYVKFYFRTISDSWYKSLFKSKKGLTGEISPSYSILEEADIQKMYNISPSAKIILILRNPIERAWSHYRFQHKNEIKNLDQLDHERVLDFVNSERQVKRSNYLFTIENYLKVFPKNQILLCFYDAIKDNPTLLLNEICSFIEPTTTFDLSKTEVNKTIHRSVELDMPLFLKEYLKKKNYNQIKELSNLYGGYCEKWLHEWYDDKNNVPTKNLKPTITL